MFKGRSWQSFCKKVGEIVGARDTSDLYGVVFGVFSDVVKMDVDVLAV